MTDLDHLEALASAAEPFPWDIGSGHVGPYSLALLLIERVRELERQRGALARGFLRMKDDYCEGWGVDFRCVTDEVTESELRRWAGEGDDRP